MSEGSQNSLPGRVLFDLDGTLCDSADSIVASMRRAFLKQGLEPPEESTLRTFVGPPLATALDGLGFEPALVQELVRTYRTDYNEGGLYEATVYPGVRGMLARLATDGWRIAVATSKPQHTARRIVEHFGLQRWLEEGMDSVFGSDPARIAETKADVIDRALQGAGESGQPNHGRTVMVGDRHHDVDGARVHGIDCVGVRWGYAPVGELEHAGAVAVMATPDALVDFLQEHYARR